MTMSAKPSMVSPSPWMTVALRRGVHSSASCAQFVLTTFGTTTSRGKASAASAASSACAVLPRPGSSASRKVRWPAAAAATTWAWWCISSRPADAVHHVGGLGQRHAGGVAAVLEGAEQGGQQLPARRAGWWSGGRRGTAEKSGARKGFASWRAMTVWGTTRRVVAPPGRGPRAPAPVRARARPPGSRSFLRSTAAARRRPPRRAARAGRCRGPPSWPGSWRCRRAGTASRPARTPVRWCRP